MKIVIIILIVLAAFLWMKLKVNIKLCNETIISINYFLFRFRINGKKKAPKKKANLKPSKNKKTKKKKANFKQIFCIVMDLFSALPKPLKRLIRSTVIQVKRFYLVTGGNDSSEAAITYGNNCCYIYTGLSVLKNIVTVKAEKDDICIGVNFLAEEVKKDINIYINIRLISLLTILTSFAARFLMETFVRTKGS